MSGKITIVGAKSGVIVEAVPEGMTHEEFLTKRLGELRASGELPPVQPGSKGSNTAVEVLPLDAIGKHMRDLPAEKEIITADDVGVLDPASLFGTTELKEP